jgi:type IV fimbrial biogenesis protein FimT
MRPVYGLVAPVVTPYSRWLVAQCGDMKTAMRQKGFTLLEMMAAIGIAAILLGLAVPSLTNFIRSSNLSASARNIVVDFALARNEAVLRAATVTVCTSTDLANCANTGWNDGRIIFVDGGALGVVDAGDVIVSVTQPMDSALTAAATNLTAANVVSYSAQGRLADWGQITVCAPNQMERRITVRRSGSATLDRTVVPC